MHLSHTVRNSSIEPARRHFKSLAKKSLNPISVDKYLSSAKGDTVGEVVDHLDAKAGSRARRIASTVLGVTAAAGSGYVAGLTSAMLAASGPLLPVVLLGASTVLAAASCAVLLKDAYTTTNTAEASSRVKEFANEQVLTQSAKIGPAQDPAQFLFSQ